MKTFRTLASTLAIMLGVWICAPGAYAQSPTGAPMFTVLNGGNECDAAVPPNCRQGDLDAIGSATIAIYPRDAASRWVCWGITVKNLAGATAAHIHRGVSGLNGPIVVGLTPPVAPAGANPGASSGCVAAAIAVADPIRVDPTGFYVNVHNAAFPGGAVRGQLH